MSVSFKKKRKKRSQLAGRQEEEELGALGVQWGLWSEEWWVGAAVGVWARYQVYLG